MSLSLHLGDRKRAEESMRTLFRAAAEIAAWRASPHRARTARKYSQI